MRETNVRNRVCRATVEHGLMQLAAARGEESERRNHDAEGRELAREPPMGNRHLEPLFSLYAWYIPRIFNVYAIITNIHGIYVVYPRIYHGYPM